MKTGHGTSTEKRQCVICEKCTNDYIYFLGSFVTIEIPCCEGEHMRYVRRQYAQSLLAPVLRLVRKIAVGV